jgi:hypothetical protein
MWAFLFFAIFTIICVIKIPKIQVFKLKVIVQQSLNYHKMLND